MTTNCGVFYGVACRGFEIPEGGYKKQLLVNFSKNEKGLFVNLYPSASLKPGSAEFLAADAIPYFKESFSDIINGKKIKDAVCKVTGSFTMSYLDKKIPKINFYYMSIEKHQAPENAAVASHLPYSLENSGPGEKAMPYDHLSFKPF